MFKENYEDLKYHEHLLEEAKKSGNKEYIDSGLFIIGNIHQQKGDTDKAMAYYRSCLEIREELEDEHGIAELLGLVALIRIESEDYAEALDNLLEAYLLFKELEDPKIKTISENILKVKSHMNEKDFNETLNRAGIDPEEQAFSFS
ncbi:MAG: tetratricopeptide repeat protein [bacterium]|nr:tetratricopeptide repeat protein [bacterium]